MTMKHLSFVPFPLEDESPTSLIQRAAKANGCTSCYELLRFVKAATSVANYSNTLLENSAFSRALQICAPNVQDKIALGFYTPIYPTIKQSDVKINGLRVKHHNLRCLTTALCTECAREGFERFPKDLTLFVNCPYHSRAYLTSCPNCTKIIKWQTCLSNRCTCGHLLVSPIIQQSITAPDRYLLTIFKEGNAEALDMIQRVLLTLERSMSTDIESVKAHRRNLAIAIRNKDIGAMVDAIHGCLPSQTVDDIDISLIIFKGYLDTVTYELLRERLIANMGRQHFPIAKVFLPIRTLIKYVGMSQTAWYKSNHSSTFFGKNRTCMRCLSDTALAIKKALHAELTTIDSSIPGKKRQQHYIHIFSVAAVSECTGLPQNVIKQLSIQSTLLGHYTKTYYGDQSLTFGRYWVEKYNRNYICSQALAKELNLPKTKINDAIMSLGIDVKVGELPNNTLITKRAYKKRITNHINHPDIKNSHKKRIFNPPLSPLPAHPDLLNSDQCAELLSVKRKDINILVRAGLLPCHGMVKYGSFLINRQSVLEFKDRIIHQNELSRLLNLSPIKASSYLRKHGIHPFSGHSTNSGTVNLFKKSDLTRAHLTPITRHTKRASDNSNTDTNSANFNQATSKLCKNYNLSTGQFTRAFLKTKFAAYKSHQGAHYITLKSYNAISKILELYIPLKAADAILNVPIGYTRQLLDYGRIPNGTSQPVHFPGLVERSRILQYLDDESAKTL